MIEQIKGVYLGREEGYVLVGVRNFVFKILSDVESFSNVEVGKEIEAYTKVIVSQDDIIVYGFDSKRKRFVFEKLISVSKIGPKSAIKILSSSDTEYLVSCIVNGEVEKLSKVPGVGSKSAERIITELKDKFEKADFDSESLEAIEALVALGYSHSNARNVVKKVRKEGDNLATIIKEALKVLSKG